MGTFRQFVALYEAQGLKDLVSLSSDLDSRSYPKSLSFCSRRGKKISLMLRVTSAGCWSSRLIQSSLIPIDQWRPKLPCVFSHCSAFDINI